MSRRCEKAAWIPVLKDIGFSCFLQQSKEQEQSNSMKKGLALFVFWCRKPAILENSASGLVVKNAVSASRKLSHKRTWVSEGLGLSLLSFQVFKIFLSKPCRNNPRCAAAWRAQGVIKEGRSIIYIPTTNISPRRTSWSRSSFLEVVFDQNSQRGAQMWARTPVLSLWYTQTTGGVHMNWGMSTPP